MEIRKILYQGHFHWHAHPDGKMQGEHFEKEIQEIEEAINTFITRTREESFKSAKVACSFNKDCKNCHANKLTMEYLCGELQSSTPKEAFDKMMGSPLDKLDKLIQDTQETD